jgi:pyruvate dehydrogenase E2 component (dihydrolipoamide acetyltransferase)
MAISVVMPALEMAQETGKLLAWRKKEGDRVTKGEPLLEIETDKAVVEVEALGDGVLGGITAHEGAVIPVGQTIAWILSPGEEPPAQTAPAAPGARATSAPSAAERHSTPAAEGSKQPAATNARISPKARRLAKEHSIAIGELHGPGPDGTITTEDVQALVDDQKSSATPAGEALSQIARLMAERTTRSWTSVPHFFVARDIDAGALQEAQRGLSPAIEKAHNARLTFTDLLIALVARALAKHPRMNSSWTGGAIRPNADVNISVAMAVKEGVVGAVIHKTDVLDLGEISVQRRDLTERARAGRLRPTDVAGGTFTISNLGMYKVDAFTAIIMPPQAAILAVGAVSDRVVAVNGQPVVRPMMTLTLSTDHRVADGARAAEFLNELAEMIRQPEKWLR